MFADQSGAMASLGTVDVSNVWKIQHRKFQEFGLINGSSRMGDRRGGTGWLAWEPTGVPWHKRFDREPLLLSSPVPASPRVPKAATWAPKSSIGGVLIDDAELRCRVEPQLRIATRDSAECQEHVLFQFSNPITSNHHRDSPRSLARLESH